MSPRPVVLLVHAGDDARQPVRALRAGAESAGADVVDVPVAAGAGGVSGALRAARAAYGEHDVRAVITVSPPGGVHAVGRALALRDIPWIAHIGPGWDVAAGDRWRRAFDPRIRALRRALLVTTWSRDEAEHVNRELAVIVSPLDGAGDPQERAATHVRTALRPRAAGRRLLMLGTTNTPHVEHMALAMQARGFDVEVAGDPTPAYPPSVLPDAGIRVHAIALPAITWLRSLVREVRPDVVHANWLPAYAFLAALVRARPLVAMAWGSDVFGADERTLRKCRYALRHADVAMTDSDALLGRLVELGADPARAHLVNWGVDRERFSPAAGRSAARALLGLPDAPTILSPRALRAVYNPATILEAFAIVRRDVPDAQLVLKHIESQTPDVPGLDGDGVHVVGHVPYELMPEYYRAADVCVSIPSSDSSPRSVWEAMACGTPAIVSDLPWTRELIADERDALVVPVDAAAVAEAMRRLLTEPELGRRISGCALALVAEHRDERREMDRLAELYERVAAGTVRS